MQERFGYSSTRSQSRVARSLRRVVCVGAATALVGFTGAEVGSTARQAPIPQPVPEPSYLAVATRGSSRSLSVVSRRTGRVSSTVTTVPMIADLEPFLDADLAADGTVWAVVVTGWGTGYLKTELRRYRHGRASAVARYVRSVRVTPAGAGVVVSILSPGNRHDRRGISALQLLDGDGKPLRTLSRTRIPADAQGLPATEVGWLTVAGWLGERDLIVEYGCCDGGNVALVNADTPSNPKNWRAFVGDGLTKAIGTVDADRVLVTRGKTAGDGVQTPTNLVGLDVYQVSSTKPAGDLLTTIRLADPDPIGITDRIVTRYGAVPLVVGPKRYPYHGPGQLVHAFAVMAAPSVGHAPRTSGRR